MMFFFTAAGGRRSNDFRTAAFNSFSSRQAMLQSGIAAAVAK